MLSSTFQLEFWVNLPRWHWPFRSRNRTAPCCLPAPNASNSQACRAHVFPWRPGSAQSLLIPFPWRGKRPWTLLPAGRALTHFRGNSPGSMLYCLVSPCSMCCWRFCAPGPSLGKWESPRCWGGKEGVHRVAYHDPGQHLRDSDFMAWC